MDLHLLTRADWAARAARAKSPDQLADVGLLKSVTVEIRGVNAEQRTIDTTITTGTPDRDRDVLSPGGWNLRNYRKNPVVLWGHDHRIPAIARSTVKRDGDTLTSTDTFPEAGTHPMADLVFSLASGKFLNAKSVGFIPVEWTYDEDRQGFNFRSQELIEHSWVNVPANPEALQRAKAAGIDLAPMREWAEQALDEIAGGPVVHIPRAVLERAWTISSDGQILVPVDGLKAAPTPTPEPAPAPSPSKASAQPTTPPAPAKAPGEQMAEDFLDAFGINVDGTGHSAWPDVAAAMAALCGTPGGPATAPDSTVGVVLAYQALEAQYVTHGKTAPGLALVLESPCAGERPRCELSLSDGGLWEKHYTDDADAQDPRPVKLEDLSPVQLLDGVLSTRADTRSADEFKSALRAQMKSDVAEIVRSNLAAARGRLD